MAVIGRPSAGKSTLVNRICGHDLTIVAPSPQTTRSRIRGILTRPDGQLLLIDTPGFQISERRFDTRLRTLTSATIDDADVVLAVVDVARPDGQEESAILDLAASFAGPVAIALNKTDLARAARRQEFNFGPRFAPAAVIRVSARTGAGIKTLTDALIRLSPPGPPMYDDDRYTDQPQEMRIAEVIRGHAIRATREELPQSLYVELADLETRAAGVWARAFVTVERDSQKGILIGHGGRQIAAIRREAESDLREILGCAVHLDLRVKVHKGWRQDARLLERLIR